MRQYSDTGQLERPARRVGSFGPRNLSRVDHKRRLTAAYECFTRSWDGNALGQEHWRMTARLAAEATKPRRVIRAAVRLAVETRHDRRRAAGGACIATMLDHHGEGWRMTDLPMTARVIVSVTEHSVCTITRYPEPRVIYEPNQFFRPRDEQDPDFCQVFLTRVSSTFYNEACPSLIHKLTFQFYDMVSCLITFDNSLNPV